ncbi:hypothetical protein [Shewanella waksmanii]|uniref:hypothetical protein n=1 Tax=Shewanella waksmanii TaxID=213783 RepID=UPI0004B84721|nr:hypothetical protein [Shewanella waksmanii]
MASFFYGKKAPPMLTSHSVINLRVMEPALAYLLFRSPSSLTAHREYNLTLIRIESFSSRYLLNP